MEHTTDTGAIVLPAVLPCPFCNSADVRVEHVYVCGDQVGFRSRVACNTCKANGPEIPSGSSRNDTQPGIAAWNRGRGN